MRLVVCALFGAIFLPIACPRANVVLPMGCTGTVFIMPVMSGEQNALVLTNGHCLDVGDYEWQGARHLRPNQFLFNYGIDKANHSMSVFRSRGKGGNNYAMKRIVFGTITVTDLAIIELDVTYSSLKGSGYRVYQLARHMPKMGMTLEFRSYNQNFDGICRVHGIVPSVVEGPYAWTNVVKMELNEKCRIYPGVSGTPGILKNTNEIYAVGNTEYTSEGKECDIMNPCERDVASGKLRPGLPTQTYAMPTAPLYDCYNTNISYFDFDMMGCKLKNAGGNH
jgi:hypothetical protein